MSSTPIRTSSEKVFDFRKNIVVDQPKSMPLPLLSLFKTDSARPVSCPPASPRFPKPAPVSASNRPGHYDPRMGMAARKVHGWENRPIQSMSRDARIHVFKKEMMMRRAGPKSTPALKAAPKPDITDAQLVREAFICKTAKEMMVNFTSVVIDVKVQRGARIMWTSVPEDLKHIFNVTNIKTVDTWKQTMHGDCTLDISMFKKGDRIKMSIQSIGVSGKYANQPLIRGVPDIAQHPNTLKTNSPKTETVGSFKTRVANGKNTCTSIVKPGRFAFSQMRARAMSG